MVTAGRVYLWVTVDDFCHLDSRVPAARIEKPERGDGALRMTRYADFVRGH
jgi:hypothetical protein